MFTLVAYNLNSTLVHVSRDELGASKFDYIITISVTNTHINYSIDTFLSSRM